MFVFDFLPLSEPELSPQLNRPVTPGANHRVDGCDIRSGAAASESCAGRGIG
jgi:hypothetical protein